MLRAIGSLSGVASCAGSEIGIAKIIGMEVDQRKERKLRNGAKGHKELIEKGSESKSIWNQIKQSQKSK
jgi:hypothetical protein